MYVTVCHVTICHVTVCYVTICHVTMCHVTVCHAITDTTLTTVKSPVEYQHDTDATALHNSTTQV